MSRIRSIKPEFWFDEELAALDSRTRLFFIGMWNHADKSGRMEDRPEALRAKIFPYEVDIDAEKILKELSQTKNRSGQSFIQRYRVNLKKYIAITNWHHQRPHVREPESTIPAPILVHVEAVPEQCPGSAEPEQGAQEAGGFSKRQEALVRGGDAPTADQTKPKSILSVSQTIDFEAFWKAYPNKVGKGKARALWAKLNPSPDLLARIMDAVAKQSVSQQWKSEGGRFIPHPTTWLGHERWDDELPTLKTETKTAVGDRVVGYAATVKGKYDDDRFR